MKKILFVVAFLISISTSCSSSNDEHNTGEDDQTVDYTKSIIGKWWFEGNEESDIRANPEQALNAVKEYLEKDILQQQKYFIEFKSDKSAEISFLDKTINITYKLDNRKLALQFEDRIRDVDIMILVNGNMKICESHGSYLRNALKEELGNIDFEIKACWVTHKYSIKE